MNSIPIKGKPSVNPTVHVYLGLDGLSHRAVTKARARGAFAGWDVARFIPMFPATSDASWTRILHTGRFAGYEYGHYDPRHDKLYNTSVEGVLVHAIPPLDSLAHLLPETVRAPVYYEAFDHHATDYISSVWSYERPVFGWYRALDHLFVALAGRSEKQHTFSAYMLEGDVIGHIRSEEDFVDVLVTLSERIQDFKRRHPERSFVFTLFGDHGMDSVRKPPQYVVDFRDQMRAVGITPVDTLERADKVAGPAAVAVLHTRVTYVALHTRPARVAEVARLASTAPAADLVIARGSSPGSGYPEDLEWVDAWREGALAARFGYQRSTDTYWLPADVDWAALDLPVAFTPGAESGVFTDETLFAASAERTYPDFFFRARTALEPISVEFPAEAVVSLRDPYMSVGFLVPIVGGLDLASAASHGAMSGQGSVSALLTEERSLPATVRSDTLLELFPALSEHLLQRGLTLLPGADGASLDYAGLP
ncbi:alkaline phosphatase family protein [Archangium violaceum]|nr:alkaline phosphatase family protein [Archangium violaceum]